MIKRASIITIAVLCLYLIFWPSPIEPVAWNAPENKGFVAPFEQNDRLSQFSDYPLQGHGPEDIAFDANGLGYVGLEEGWIVRFDPNTNQQENWVNTGGRPLGIEFGPDGALYVADSKKGLLKVYPDGKLEILAQAFEGQIMGFVDDLDVAQNGDVYFSDASTRFSAIELGESEASLFDVLEHSGSGRILKYDAQSQQLSIVLEGLNFANGVALDQNEQFLLINETGGYRVHKYWLAGDKAGTAEVLLDNLPGIPDNINRDQQGRFWLALFAPRNSMLDIFSDWPSIRKAMAKLPAFMRPKAEKYAHVVHMTGDGQIIKSYQDPSASFAASTGALGYNNELWVGSLHEMKLLRGAL